LHFYTLIFGNNKFFEDKNFKKFFECLILQFLLHFIQKIIHREIINFRDMGQPSFILN